MKTYPYLLTIIFTLTLSGCDNGEGASGATPNEPLTNFFKTIPFEPIYPDNKAFASAKAELGELLFWDAVLSGEQNVACASCHHPDFA